jgi:hypothetical protein
MTIDEFIKKYQGQAIGYNGYVGECLSLVKQYIKEVFGIEPPPSGTNSAYGYWSNFPNPLPTIFDKVNTGIPQKGDIVIWKPTAGNPYGHIAIFVEGDDKSFRSFDQNYGGKQAHIQNHSYASVVGWLHPKGGEMQEMTNDELNSRRHEWNVELARHARQALFGHIDNDGAEADAKVLDAAFDAGNPYEAGNLIVRYVNSDEFKADWISTADCQAKINDAVSQTQEDFQQYKDGEAERTEIAVKKAVSDRLNGLTERVTIESIVWNFIKKLFKK